MNRIGLDADNLEYCEKVIRKYSNMFDLNDMFTHLCVAYSKTEKYIEFTRK